MSDDIKPITHLLHDARLLDLNWIEEQREIVLVVNCLRCDHAGKKIDSPVTLRLCDVRSITAYESLPRVLDDQVPNLKSRHLLTKKDLAKWTHRGGLYFAINSNTERFEYATAFATNHIWSSTEPQNSCLEIYLSTAGGRLFIACSMIESYSQDDPLPLHQWESEYANWWGAWKEHWDSKETKPDGSEPTEFDAAIPIADDSRDVLIAAPQAPAYIVDSDAPHELLEPIRDYHEGHLAEDWIRMAGGYPNLDQTPQQRASVLHDENRSGKWLYIRQVDKWWQRDQMACVVVRGVEHGLNQHGLPENEETVVSYELRRYQDRWIIWNYSQGWPRYGSAPALRNRQPWHDEWDIASHKTPSEYDRSPHKLELFDSYPQAFVITGLVVLILVGLFGCLNFLEYLAHATVKRGASDAAVNRQQIERPMD